MTLEILVRPEAEADLLEAYRWYEDKNPGLGKEFLDCVEAAMDLIERHPQLYQIVYKNIRRALVKRFPYGVFYITEKNRIVVLAVLHAKRDPDIIKTRFH